MKETMVVSQKKKTLIKPRLGQWTRGKGGLEWDTQGDTRMGKERQPQNMDVKGIG